MSSTPQETPTSGTCGWANEARAGVACSRDSGRYTPRTLTSSASAFPECEKASRRRRSPAALSVLLLATLLANTRCAADGNHSSDDGGGPPSGSGGRSGSTVIIIGPSGTGAGPALDELDPRCGVADCSPDDAEACAGIDFGEEEEPGEGEGEGEGGAGGEGGARSQGGWGGLSANPGDLDEVAASCQVSLDEPSCTGQDCERSATCLPTGLRGKEQTCLSQGDCAPGLACVDVGSQGASGGLSVGVCKPYCCEGARSCKGDTYCSGASLLGAPGLVVPVCTEPDDCSLTDPYPCPEGGECACAGELACIVVRSDGRTACAPPGAGQAGDPCTGQVVGECAHGHVCSPELGCLEVCRTTSEGKGDCEDGQLCQTPSGFPPSLGVCVGAQSGRAPAP